MRLKHLFNISVLVCQLFRFSVYRLLVHSYTLRKGFSCISRTKANQSTSAHNHGNVNEEKRQNKKSNLQVVCMDTIRNEFVRRIVYMNAISLCFWLTKCANASYKRKIIIHPLLYYYIQFFAPFVFE